MRGPRGVVLWASAAPTPSDGVRPRSLMVSPATEFLSVGHSEPEVRDRNREAGAAESKRKSRSSPRDALKSRFSKPAWPASPLPTARSRSRGSGDGCSWEAASGTGRQRPAVPARRKPGASAAAGRRSRPLCHRLNAIISSTVPKKTEILPEENNTPKGEKNIHSGK